MVRRMAGPVEGDPDSFAVPEEAMWLEGAIRAARGRTADTPPAVGRALASNLARGFVGWPQSKTMPGFSAVTIRPSPAEIRAVRSDTHELMLSVIGDGFAPYWRKRFAVLALANLHVLGVGDALHLRRIDGLPWLLPSLREYLRDALAGTGVMSLGPAPFDRNRAVEEEILAADAPVGADAAAAPTTPAPQQERQPGPLPVVPAAPHTQRHRPCDARALAQYHRALEIRPDLTTGTGRLKAIYAVVKEQVHDRNEDGELKPFETWRRYLNRANCDPAKPKRAPRAGREGRSVVKREDL